MNVKGLRTPPAKSPLKRRFWLGGTQIEAEMLAVGEKAGSAGVVGLLVGEKPALRDVLMVGVGEKQRHPKSGSESLNARKGIKTIA